jgi:hypothetical protein
MTQYLHVGLGKTGSTFLQESVFPALCKELGIYYIDDLDHRIEQLKMNLYLREEGVNSIFPDDCLISCEGLAGWDPHVWDINANILKDIFGSDTVIILTIREPKAYLTSVYLQRCFHEGDLLDDKFFFLEHENYYDHLPLPKFSIDEFSYTRLLEVYKDKFLKVHIVKFEELFELNFITDIWGREEIKKNISANINNATTNRAYSGRAVKLVRKLEMFLNIFGYRINGNERSKSLRALNQAMIGINRKDDTIKVTSYRLFRGILREFKVRHFIQNRFDKVFKYIKFELDFSQNHFNKLQVLEEEYKVIQSEEK